MEFSFNINNLLVDTITKLDNTVTPGRRNAAGCSQNELRTQLLAVIDKMGEASSKAQGLYTVITTGRKLQLSDHLLYVMKDPSGNNGRGTVVGILKIGRKKLFVYSDRGNVHEMEPLCVLDFYVHESRQRMGCGRKLFDFMLEDTGVRPCHLAIDKPSFKFSQFLKKHFHLRAEIPQVNNFVVFEGFFSNSSSENIRKKRSGYGKPPSGHSREPPIDDGYRQQQQQNGYNGYGLPPLPQSNPTTTTMPSIPTQPTTLNMRPPSGKTRSASVLSTSRKETVEYERNGQLRPLSNTRDDQARSVSANVIKSKGKQIYSRHVNNPESPIGARHASSPIGSLNGGSRPNSGNAPGVNRHNTINGDLPPTGLQIRTQNTHYGVDPPMMLNRGVTSDLSNFNLHQNYQDRRGQMKTNMGYDNSIRNPFFSRQEESALNKWLPAKEPETWTVFEGQPSYLSLSKRNYTHTRLW